MEKSVIIYVSSVKAAWEPVNEKYYDHEVVYNANHMAQNGMSMLTPYNHPTMVLVFLNTVATQSCNPYCVSKQQKYMTFCKAYEAIETWELGS